MELGGDQVWETPATPETKAGRSVAGHRHLVDMLETTKARSGSDSGPGIFRPGFPSLFPASPAGFGDDPKPVPSDRILLRYGRLSEGPTQAGK